MKRLSFYFLFFFQKYYKSRYLYVGAVLLPARTAPSLVRMAMGLQTASRPARRQAWYMYGPIFWTSRAWLQPPVRGDPSLLVWMATGLQSAGPNASACCRFVR